jgi:putative addiction module antidote
MVREIKVRQVGGSVGATIPKEMAERLHVEAGDTLFAVETEDGILLTPYEPPTREALDIADRASKRYRNALREIAK